MYLNIESAYFVLFCRMEYSIVFLAIMTLQMTSVSCYKSGPPVSGHPELCQTMYPSGHGAEPQSDTPPYSIRVLNSANCYNDSSPIEGQ